MFYVGIPNISHSQVKEPPQVDFNAVEKGLTELTESGNVQALAQRAVAAGSVMNKEKSGNDTTANDEAVKVMLAFYLMAGKCYCGLCNLIVCNTSNFAGK